MNPFNDENYYFQSDYYSQNPFTQPLQITNNKMKWQRTLNTAIRSITTINQIIPIINQVCPLIHNTKNGLFILKAMRQLDDINFDDVIHSIHPIDRKKEDVKEDLFENML